MLNYDYSKEGISTCMHHSKGALTECFFDFNLLNINFPIIRNVFEVVRIDGSGEAFLRPLDRVDVIDGYEHDCSNDESEREHNDDEHRDRKWIHWLVLG